MSETVVFCHLELIAEEHFNTDTFADDSEIFTGFVFDFKFIADPDDSIIFLECTDLSF